MKFGFVAKHRGIWPAEWLCGALGVSRGGFYAWLTRPRSRRSRSDEELGGEVLKLLENWRGASFADENQQTGFGEPGKGAPHGNENTCFAAHA